MASLHVSLPDDMREFVDHRTNGQNQYSTPSEYVRSLIRSDMEKENERLYVYKRLLQASDDIKRGNFVDSSVLDIMNES